ncbi:hypothetical protein ACFQ51_56550 [Streptomyces kaempferi]
MCSLTDDPELWNLRVRSTTNPVQLALWHGTGPVTIFGTYASLGVLAEAFEGAYGQQLAPVDLAVVDEAHRTSGSMGKTWADIHDQTVIPARRWVVPDGHAADLAGAAELGGCGGGS